MKTIQRNVFRTVLQKISSAQTIFQRFRCFNSAHRSAGGSSAKGSADQLFRNFAQMNFLLKPVSLFLITLLLSFNTDVQGQTAVGDTSRKVLQFSGMVIDADSLYPIPFVAIVIKGTQRGVYSTGSGYYSIVAQENDTIEFYSLGYKTGLYVLPDTFSSTQVNHVQTLKMDTVLMSEMVVYPWPSRDKFKSAFLAVEVPDDDMERARMNLAQQRMMAAANTVSADGGQAYRNQMQQQTDKNYYAGQYQPNNLLNPVAWSRFIQSLRK